MSWFEDLAKGGIEGFGSAIKDAVSAFKADPTKIAELEASAMKAAQDFQASVIASVNATMQAEAKSEHWMQWCWRPLIGLTFAGVVINNYILYAYFARFGVVQIVIPDSLWMAFLAVLGVAAWTRGQAQVESAKANGVGK